MSSFVQARVVELLSERRGLQRVLVQRDEGEPEPAYVLTEVVGPVTSGDDVVINTTAVELGLGTGGWHVVHWNLSRKEWRQKGKGHVMKQRYTSLQLDTGVAEETEKTADDLQGMPVVACLLHSQVAVVAASIKQQRPQTRVVYVMTDQAALPMAFSDLVAQLRDARLLDATITAGQAFGGEYEAVNVTSALRLAKHVADADVTIVGQGPGVVGTNSPVAFSGLEVASILDQAKRDNGRTLLALRWSDADPRDRHRGLSHHSKQVLERMILPTTIGVPHELEVDTEDRHEVVRVEIPDVAAFLHSKGIEVTSMGRKLQDDQGFTQAAAAAGTAAVLWIDAAEQ